MVICCALCVSRFPPGQATRDFPTSRLDMDRFSLYSANRQKHLQSPSTGVETQNDGCWRCYFVGVAVATDDYSIPVSLASPSLPLIKFFLTFFIGEEF